MKSHAVLFKGGIGRHDGMLSGDPGRLIRAVNYEALPNGGYETTPGYTGLAPFPGFSVNEGLQVISFNPELGVLGAGDHDTLGPAIIDEYGDTRLNLTGTSHGFTDECFGVFPHDGKVWHWNFFIGDFGRVDAVLTRWDNVSGVEVSALNELRPADATSTAASEYGGSRGIVHADHLWVTNGKSLFCSGLGNPASWAALDGATEFRMNSAIVGLTATAGGVLLIYTGNGVFGLYGTSADTFELKRVLSDIRVLPLTVQDAGMPIFVSQGGKVTTLQAAQEFGDFSSSAIDPELDHIMKRMLTVHASFVDRTNSRYHIIFDDGDKVYGPDYRRHLCISIHNNQFVGATFLKWEHDITLFTEPNYANSDTNNTLYPIFGASRNGDLYAMLSPVYNSFAGQPILSFLTPRFNHCGSPGTRKRFRRLHIEIDTVDYEGASLPQPGEVDRITKISVLPSFDGNDPTLGLHPTTDMDSYDHGETEIPPEEWGEAEWSHFMWGGREYQNRPISVKGVGESITATFVSSRLDTHGHRLRGYIVDYDMRRRNRG